MRETSIEAYRTIQENGLLSERRWQVYNTLFLNGPLTTGEIWKYYFSVHTKIPQNSINPRLSELSRLGVIRAVGTKKCTVTGHTCTIWDVTANLPVKSEKAHREKCRTCGGKGYVEHAQTKMF
jgi:hypothetical protein